MESEKITLNEAALLTGVYPNTIRRWIDYGKISSTKEVINNRRSILVDKNEVIEMSLKSRCKKNERSEIETAINMDRQRHKEYREANKDALRKVCKDHYEANKDEINKRHKEYREANKDVLREWSKDHYAANKDEINKRRREKYKDFIIRNEIVPKLVNRFNNIKDISIIDIKEYIELLYDVGLLDEYNMSILLIGIDMYNSLILDDDLDLYDTSESYDELELL